MDALPLDFVPEWFPGVDMSWVEQSEVDTALDIDEFDELDVAVGTSRSQELIVVVPRF